MTDIALAEKKFGYDISYKLGDFQSDEGFETAVMLSLFTDRRVAKEELPDGETDRRGWWGDLFSDFPADLTGSRLWLLDRAKLTEQTRNQVEEYVTEALQWFVDDGVAASLEVLAELNIPKRMIPFSVKLTRPKTRDVYFYRFQLLWDAESLKVRKV